MDAQPNLSATAFLISDAARAAMLMALADGRALPAGELAHAAGVTAQTASSHLAKLLDGGLVAVEQQGRHRYYRLADPQVALALESLASIAARRPLRRKTPTRDAQKLRLARCCYDHLAGQAGVAITLGLVQRGFLVAACDKTFEVTPGREGVVRQHGARRRGAAARPSRDRASVPRLDRAASSSCRAARRRIARSAVFERLAASREGVAGSADHAGRLDWIAGATGADAGIGRTGRAGSRGGRGMTAGF